MTWVEYYRKLFADPTGHSRDAQWREQFAPRDIEGPDSVDILDVKRLVPDIDEVIKDLASGKASGLDGIPPEWFKWLLQSPEQSEDDSHEDVGSSHAFQALMKCLFLLSREQTYLNLMADGRDRLHSEIW